MIEERINTILDELRPFLVNDGGDIEFIKFENGTVFVKMKGACVGCYMLDVTLKDGIEMALKEEIPEVKEVVTVE